MNNLYIVAVASSLIIAVSILHFQKSEVASIEREVLSNIVDEEERSFDVNSVFSHQATFFRHKISTKEKKRHREASILQNTFLDNLSYKSLTYKSIAFQTLSTSDVESAQVHFLNQFPTGKFSPKEFIDLRKKEDIEQNIKNTKRTYKFEIVYDRESIICAKSDTPYNSIDQKTFFCMRKNSAGKIIQVELYQRFLQARRGLYNVVNWSHHKKFGSTNLRSMNLDAFQKIPQVKEQRSNYEKNVLSRRSYQTRIKDQLIMIDAVKQLFLDLYVKNRNTEFLYLYQRISESFKTFDQLYWLEDHKNSGSVLQDLYKSKKEKKESSSKEVDAKDVGDKDNYRGVNLGAFWLILDDEGHRYNTQKRKVKQVNLKRKTTDLIDISDTTYFNYMLFETIKNHYTTGWSSSPNGLMYLYHLHNLEEIYLGDN